MTIEEALVAHLRWYDQEVAALVGQSKIFPALVPEEIPSPAIAYELTDQERGMSHSGPTGLVVSTLAVHCLMRGFETYGAAKDLGNRVKAALDYPTSVWGDLQVARTQCVVGGGQWSPDTQDWTVTVTAVINHMG